MQLDHEEFYYGVDGERFGPVSPQELRLLLEQGRLRAEDFLWDEATQDWVAFEQIPVLKALLPAASLVPAGFFPRLVAYMIDGFLLWLMSMLLIGSETLLRYADIVYGESLLRTTPYTPEEMSLVLRVNTILLLMELTYRAVSESSPWQATVGKRLLGLKVVDRTGGRLSLPRAALRFGGHLASRLTLMLGYLMAAFTERKQALHDKIADTYVVRR